MEPAASEAADLPWTAMYDAVYVSLEKLKEGLRIMNQTFELSAEEVFALGAQAQAICYTSAEHRASVESFLNRSADRGPRPANQA